jgi:hypothetical protein
MFDGNMIDVTFYLMEMLYQGAPQEQRDRQWAPVGQAVEQLTHPESKYLVIVGDQPRLCQEVKKGNTES